MQFLEKASLLCNDFLANQTCHQNPFYAKQVALTEGAAMKEALDVSIKHNQDLQARAREKEAAEVSICAFEAIHALAAL